MTDSTIKAIQDFCDAVSQLAQGCYHMVGEDVVTEVINKAEVLKNQVKHEASEL